MTGFCLPARWPRPADHDAAVSLRQDLAEALWLDRPDALQSHRLALVDCLGGNSRYLADLARREQAFLARLVGLGPTRVLGSALRRLRALRPETDRTTIAAGLRQAKRQVALATAIADLGGLWTLAQITGALSLLAEAALRVSCAHLLLAAHRSGQIRLPSPARPERGSGFVVLGMGKLGAAELNYSSDIDLVLFWDPAVQHGVADPGRGFARIATGLVSLMEARDSDGYVFRTDLRLRPDPGATPPAVSLPAAIAYYESYGQTWERAAMTKARPVAGDLEAGRRFLDTIRPFVWRRHLDFAAIEDIHAMKRRIDRHKPAPSRGFGEAAPEDPVGALLGHDVKLGHGGIREIEFIAQTLQLVWGGRSPDLRDPTTLGALDRLAKATLLRRDTAASLAATYGRLRGIEHRLQMRDDRQTHSLPRSRDGFAAFATFMGEAVGDAEMLARSLLPELRRTRRRFETMVRSPVGRHDDARPGEVGPAAFDIDADDAAARLAELGFSTGPRALEILRLWQTDRYRALREARARSLLRRLLPSMLSAFAEQADPLGTLVRFDTLLSRQNAGVQLLSLFERTPSLLGRIAFILGASPALGDHLAAVPQALDGLLEGEAHRTAGRAMLRDLDQQMRRASGVEEAIGIARSLVRGEEFRLSVAQLDGTLGVDAAGTARTVLAEHVIGHMLRIVRAEHRGRYGGVPGGGMSVVALGKAGSREMMPGSDLDLMLIYDHPESVPDSVLRPGTGRGGRSVPSSVYFARLAHALIAALSAPGAEGPLYALDMRLRPSGSKGPVAVSLASFRRYHREASWTWERMALSRARVVAGPPALRRAVSEAIREAIGGPGRGTGLRADAAAMRARVARDLPPAGPWDVKLRAGGLLEVEFIAQVLQLVSTDAGSRHPTTRIAFSRLARTGLLSRRDAGMLIGADRFWRALQGHLRILLGLGVPDRLPGTLPPAAIAALLAGLGIEADAEAGGLDGLRTTCEAMAEAVRDAFLRLVGPLQEASE